MNTSTYRKNVIITGANGHLGTAVTHAFLDNGYNVIATVINEAAKEQLPSHENLQVEAVDLTSEGEAASFVKKTIEQYKTIDAALLLVGGFAMGTIAETSSEAIKKQMALNFETAYHVARPVYQHMMQHHNGKIVFIGARPALQPADSKNMIAYALSKSLLFRLAEAINAETKGTNVTATVIVPSTLDTAPNRESMPNANPDKWVKPEALAEILEFIVSDKASPLRELVLKVYNNA